MKSWLGKLTNLFISLLCKVHSDQHESVCANQLLNVFQLPDKFPHQDPFYDWIWE